MIDRDTIVPEEYTSYFRSVIVFGEMRILEDEAEKWSAMERLSLKYPPQGNRKGLGAALRSGTCRCTYERQRGD